MKKTTGSFFLKLLLVLMVTVLAGCGAANDNDERESRSKRHKDDDTMASIVSIETSKEYSPFYPPRDLTEPSKEQDTPVFDEERDEIMVTAIYNGERHDFIFDEDYELFFKYPKGVNIDSWTLDLNGHTIPLKKTLSIATNCAITNGEFIVCCDIGIESAIASPRENDYNHNISFNDYEGPFTLTIKNGCTGIRQNGQIELNNITVNSYGTFMVADTSTFVPEKKGYNISAYKNGEYTEIEATSMLELVKVNNCTINLFSGTGFVIPASDKRVKLNVSLGEYSCKMTFGRDVVVVDNYGELEVEFYRNSNLTEPILIDGGIGINNHEGAVINRADLQLQIENGTGIMNDGDIEKMSTSIMVRQGCAIENSGFIYMDGNFYTYADEVYGETMIYNTTGAVMIGQINMIVGKALGATFISNSGLFNCDLRMYGGMPKSQYHNVYFGGLIGFFTKNEYYDDATNNPDYFLSSTGYYNAFNVGKDRVFSDNKFFVCEREGEAIIGNMTAYMYCKDEGKESYVDSSVFIYNMSKEGLALDYLYLHLNGNGGYGIVNESGALLTTKAPEDEDAYPPSFAINMYMYDIDGMFGDEVCDKFDDDLAISGKTTGTVKGCTGIYNAGNFSGNGYILCEAMADDSNAIKNSGSIVADTISAARTRKIQIEFDITMYGNNNKGIVNDGSIFSYDLEKRSEYGGSFSNDIIEMHGNKNVAVDNGRTLDLYGLSCLNRGAGNTGIKNTGKMQTLSGLHISTVDIKEEFTKDTLKNFNNNTMLFNDGMIEAESIWAMANGIAQKCLINSKDGKIICRDEVVIGSETSAGISESILLENKGKISTNNMTVGYGNNLNGVFTVNNLGDIEVTKKLSVYYSDPANEDKCFTNEGTIASKEFSLIYSESKNTTNLTDVITNEEDAPPCYVILRNGQSARIDVTEAFDIGRTLDFDSVISNQGTIQLVYGYLNEMDRIENEGEMVIDFNNNNKSANINSIKNSNALTINGDLYVYDITNAGSMYVKDKLILEDAFMKAEGQDYYQIVAKINNVGSISAYSIEPRYPYGKPRNYKFDDLFIQKGEIEIRGED